MKERIKGTAYLLLATIIWGSTFIAQSVGMDHIGPFTFQALRCLLACGFLFPLSRFTDRDKANFKAKWLNPRLWKTGLMTGFALFMAAGLQQMGMIYSTAGKAGFLTAMYIVLVPLMGIFLGRKPSAAVWVSVVIAVVGLYFLSGAGISEINRGDLLLIGCAFWFAVQITLVDRFGLGLDGVRLNCVQSVFCGLFSLITMLFTETVSLPGIAACWLPLAYSGILSMGVAFTLQIYGQQLLETTQASIIMSLESVFALIFGWLLLHERLSTLEMIGCCAMFCAVLLSQIPKKSPA